VERHHEAINRWGIIESPLGHEAVEQESIKRDNLHARRGVSMSAERGQGYERLVELIIDSKIAASLHVVVDKRIADVLASGTQPRSGADGPQRTFCGRRG
jgi:hypothetical protein